MDYNSPTSNYFEKWSKTFFLSRGSWRRGPNPISQEIVFFKFQLKSHNPSLCCSNWNPIPIFLLFFFKNPSPSAQNPISQPLKKANPSSHFTPSRPSLYLLFAYVKLEQLSTNEWPKCTTEYLRRDCIGTTRMTPPQNLRTKKLAPIYHLQTKIKSWKTDSSQTKWKQK